MNIAFTFRAGQNIEQLLTDSHGRLLLLDSARNGETTGLKRSMIRELEKIIGEASPVITRTTSIFYHIESRDISAETRA
jgi:hypothetical protein